MSIAGGNPSLIIDTLVNTAQLGTGLRQAEAQVAQSASRMTQQVDKFGQAWGGASSAMMLRFAGPAFAVAMADKFARTFADAITKRAGIIAGAIEGIYEAGASVPLLGVFPEFARRNFPMEQGIPLGERRFRRLLYGEQVLPEDAPGGLGGMTFRSGTGGLLGFFGVDDLLERMYPGLLATVPRGGVSAPNDPRQVEYRIQQLQRRLQDTQPVPTRSEMLSEQLSRQMGGAMGQAQTALGTFKFAQMGADAQAEIARNVTKQVDLMMQIRDATEELRKLTASN